MESAAAIRVAPGAPAVLAPRLWLANVALAAGFWAWLAGELWFEWSASEQYAYGLFVPFLTAYLLWLRAEERPAPAPRGGSALPLAAAAMAALAQYPIAVIFAANADWRLLAWTEAALALGVSLLLLRRWGGWPWVRHFTPALALMLFAVPWPSAVQIRLVEMLMGFAADVAAEALRLLGYIAVQQGNVIRLEDGYVSVEEACSGVRSVQSTIMAGWLVGELWRYGAAGRGLLLVWAAAVAVAANLLRTLALAWIAAAQGVGVMAEWHDTAGYAVFGGSFAAVLAGAWFARPRRAAAAAKKPPPAPAPNWLPAGGVLALLTALAGAWPASAAWHALRGPASSGGPGWTLDVAAAVPEVVPEAPSEELRKALFYEEGVQAVWDDDAGRRWMIYYMEWREGRAAQLGGVHVPERCLPAVGWTMAERGPDLVWERDGVRLVFNTYAFTTATQRAYVFYGQWDPGGYPYHLFAGRERADRLADAWRGARMEGKQMLEVGIFRAASWDDATAAMREFLNTAVTVAKP